MTTQMYLHHFRPRIFCFNLDCILLGNGLYTKKTLCYYNFILVSFLFCLFIVDKIMLTVDHRTRYVNLISMNRLPSP